MKNIATALTVLLSFIMLTPSASAASVEVKWTDPSKYRDVDAGNENRKSFQERTFKNLDEHFAKLAADLTENQKLVIEVTDLDLAGDVNIGGINRMRIIKEIYFPRINFSYQLINADKSVELSGEISLKDMNFMQGSNLRYRSDSLGYEKKMLDKWFDETFKTQMTQSN